VIASFATIPHGDTTTVSPGSTADFDMRFGYATISSNPSAPVDSDGDRVGYIDIEADGVHVGRQKVTIRNPNLDGTYKIQSEYNDSLFLQINDQWGWTVNVGDEILDPDEQFRQHWKLTRHGNSYVLNNLYSPRDPGAVGRYLELPGYNRQDNADVNTREATIPPDQTGRNQRWWIRPMGADSNGGIYIIGSDTQTPTDTIGYVLDAQEAGRINRTVVVYPYWGNYPSFHRRFSQHWRLVPV
jgi:hypothetical protein